LCLIALCGGRYCFISGGMGAGTAFATPACAIEKDKEKPHRNGNDNFPYGFQACRFPYCDSRHNW
jgi:hypothetical protein